MLPETLSSQCCSVGEGGGERGGGGGGRYVSSGSVRKFAILYVGEDWGLGG